MNMKPTIEINDANFETEVLKSSQPVLIEFASGWSLPSMMMDGALEEIADEFVDLLKVARVHLDRSPNLGFQTNTSVHFRNLESNKGEELYDQYKATQLRTVIEWNDRYGGVFAGHGLCSAV
jgi:thiol-disulfide isomerase/thioredoxin